MNVSVSPLLPPKNAAEHLALSTKALEKWRCQGTGPRYLKLGNRIRYRLEDLIEWMPTLRTSTISARNGSIFLDLRARPEGS